MKYDKCELNEFNRTTKYSVIYRLYNVTDVTSVWDTQCYQYEQAYVKLFYTSLR